MEENIHETEQRHDATKENYCYGVDHEQWCDVDYDIYMNEMCAAYEEK